MSLLQKLAPGLLLLVSACVAVVIRPGDLGPVRDWPASASCPVPARSATDRGAVLALMNAERAKVGLPALTLSEPMTRAAHAYACEISARGDIGHRGSDGSTVAERLRREGVSGNLVAENTASFYPTPEAVVAAWMASPHHRENILRPGVSRVGIGQADGAEATWVVDFAS